MATILSIDTSTNPCSVAIAHNGKVLYDKTDINGQNHSKLLGIFVQEVLDQLKQEGGQLDAVALSEGPGSYTGLRIGASFAKGFCYGRDLPLILIPTLQVMAQQLMLQQVPTSGVLCPMIDARRMEVYSAIYTPDLTNLQPAEPVIVDSNSYAQWLNKEVVWFFGNGADKCKEVLTHSNARFVSGIYPQASAMSQLAEQAYHQGRFANLAYFEPFYLKEFQATAPKNKVLG